jgi:DnaK suppressor protein
MDGFEMEAKDLTQLKEILTTWLEQLLNQGDNTVLGLREASEYLSDPLDQASYEADRSFTLRIRDREHTLIKKIRNSLEDIDQGVYGICEDCGRDIAVERLKARPVARRCIECKTRMEHFERLTG